MPGDRSLLAHLFRRAGFGARPAELDYYVQRGYQVALDDLIMGRPLAGATPSMEQALDPVNRLTGNLRGRAAVPSLNEIQTTWVKKMVTTTAPLVERMTLFFHDHFATAFRPGNTVDTPELETQNNLFRDNATGNFRNLCHALIEDVAMSCWLNNNVNVPEHPNENLARELYELFILGVGNFSEKDVRESARALTGYRFAYNLQGTDPAKELTGSRYVMIFDPAQHDSGTKQILGRTGNFMPHDVVDIGLEQPAAPRYIARCLAETFVMADPSTNFVEAIASTLVSNNWELAPTLKMIFNSSEFASPAARSAIVRTPAEHVLGSLRALNRTSGDDYSLAILWMTQAGMTLYDPPNVGGWPHNMGWLGAGGMLARYNAGSQLADRHVSQGTLPGRTQLRSTTPQGWGEIFGVTDMTSATIKSMNSYLSGSPTTATTQVLDAAMITLLLASPDYILA